MAQRKLTGSQIQRRRESDKKLFLIAFLQEIVVLFFTFSIIYTFNRYEILPFKYRGLITAILIIANIYFLIILKAGINHRRLRKVGIVISALVLVFSIVISVLLNQGIAALNQVSEVADTPVEVKQVVMSLRVLKNSPILTLDDLDGKTISAPTTTDKSNVEMFYTEFTKSSEAEVTFEEVPSYLSAVELLYDSMTQAIVFNEDHLSLIRDKFPNFAEETRVVSASSLKSEEIINIKKVNTAEEPFTVFVSGIDTYGSIETSSRSDVNILVTINPNTKTILMTSIPRDMYMRIPGNGMNEWDKLTHAGIYGVQTSVEAVENFLDVGINYYVKANFTSVIALVDLIGGVEIDNPYEFTPYDKIPFPAGLQTLDGERTLVYSRERYSLMDGDNDRGKNQERVLTAIIQKMMKPEMLANFSTLLEIAQTSMQTSMSTNEMMKLVNLQMKTGTPWTIVQNSVAGDGQYGWNSYAAPGYNVYVQIPFEDSVLEAKKKINEVLRGIESSTTSTAE